VWKGEEGEERSNERGWLGSIFLYVVCGVEKSERKLQKQEEEEEGNNREKKKEKKKRLMKKIWESEKSFLILKETHEEEGEQTDSTSDCCYGGVRNRRGRGRGCLSELLCSLFFVLFSSWRREEERKLPRILCLSLVDTSAIVMEDEASVKISSFQEGLTNRTNGARVLPEEMGEKEELEPEEEEKEEDN
jgi:hypothetical protein